MNVRRFFVDKLKFNDNSNNEFSDSFYIATLMNCLADALVASATHPDSFRTADGYEDDDVLEEMREDESFKKEALNEIERYRRIDEWIASYQNVYSVTAMTCMQKLQKAGVIPSQIKQIMQYTRVGNADDVRLKAFTSLVDLKIFKEKRKVLKYLLFSLSEDLSPFVRDRLCRILGQALGSIAIKDEEVEKPAPKQTESGLILEQEALAEVIMTDDMTKSPPELALITLKNELQDDPVFKDALWQVIQAPTLSITEVVSFLDIAELLYEPSTALMATLRYPRYWKFDRWESRPVLPGQKSLVLAVKETSKIRTKPLHGLGLDAWTLVQQYGLKWSGDLSKAVINHQRDLKAQEREAKAQIVALQMQLQRQQPPTQVPKSASKAMSPPPLPTPVPERPGPKISLKRKQSTASETSGRAGSPKGQIFSPEASSPATILPPSAAPKASVPKASTPKTQRSPNISKTKMPAPSSATARPKSKPSVPTPTSGSTRKDSRIVRLKIAHPDRIRSITSKKPRPSLKVQTEQLQTKKPSSALNPKSVSSATSTPAPAPKPIITTNNTGAGGGGGGGNDFFSSPAIQSAAAGNTSLGGFRFFGGSNTASARIKNEDSEPASAISPMTTWVPGAAKKDKFGGSGGGSNGSANGSAGVPSRSGTPKPVIVRSGTPGLGGVSRAGTPKPGSALAGGGSRAGTPAAPAGNATGTTTATAGVKRSVPSGESSASTSANGTGNGGANGSAAAPAANSGEPERKKLKLKLGKKPPGA